MNDNETEDTYACELHPEFGEPEQLFNMRDWLEAALAAKGAKIVGGGSGMGMADLDIELEGYKFNVVIKPVIKGNHDKQPTKEE
jgi:hypothetical protein